MHTDNKNKSAADGVSRRRFCKDAVLASLGTAALGAVPVRAGARPGGNTGRKIKLGIVGLGHRGNMIGKLCVEHDGFEGLGTRKAKG